MSTQNGTDGAGTLAHDSKWGNVWNGVATSAISGAILALSNLDWSTWPAWVGTIGAPVAGLVVGLLTSKALPRFKRT